MEKINSKKGFTIIELITVIFIIAILSSVVVVSVSSSRAKSRDAKRISDLTAVASALQSYYADYHYYYSDTGSTGYCNPDAWGAISVSILRGCYWEMINTNRSTLTPPLLALRPSSYMSNCPNDPRVTGITCSTSALSISSRNYAYMYLPDVDTTTRAQSYYLVAQVEQSSYATATWGGKNYYVIKDGVPVSDNLSWAI